MKFSLLLAALVAVALVAEGAAAPQKKHSLSGNVLQGSGGRPAVDLKYNFNPNKNFNVNAGVTHTFGGGTSYGAGLTWRFKREAAPQKKHSVSGNVLQGPGGKPAVDLKYNFNPNSNFNLNAGVTHNFGGGTSYGAGFKWRFRRDAKFHLE